MEKKAHVSHCDCVTGPVDFEVTTQAVRVTRWSASCGSCAVEAFPVSQPSSAFCVSFPPSRGRKVAF